MTITSSSVANPSVITTSTAHGFSTNDLIQISGHTSVTPDINSIHRITVTGSSTFTIPVNVTDGGTGGTAIKVSEVLTTLLLPTGTIGQAVSKVLANGFPALLDSAFLHIGNGTDAGGVRVGSKMYHRIKSNDEERSATSVADDGELIFPVKTGETWLILPSVKIAGNTGCRINLAGPGDIYGVGRLYDSSEDSADDWGGEDIQFTLTGQYMMASGVFSCQASSDGNVRIKWCADGDPATMVGQSVLIGILVGKA